MTTQRAVIIKTASMHTRGAPHQGMRLDPLPEPLGQLSFGVLRIVLVTVIVAQGAQANTALAGNGLHRRVLCPQP